MPQYTYHRASLSELTRIWEKDIAANAGDDRWLRWREEYIKNNQNGMAVTFVVCADSEPVGQGTLLLSPSCSAIGGRTDLADGICVGNVNALRIEKAHEGKGHISHMMTHLEAHARKLGLHALTIGVEAKETRNLAIYLHWGYTKLVRVEIEDGEHVLYYRKELV